MLPKTASQQKGTKAARNKTKCLLKNIFNPRYSPRLTKPRLATAESQRLDPFCPGRGQRRGFPRGVARGADAEEAMLSCSWLPKPHPRLQPSLPPACTTGGIALDRGRAINQPAVRCWRELGLEKMFFKVTEVFINGLHRSIRATIKFCFAQLSAGTRIIASETSDLHQGGLGAEGSQGHGLPRSSTASLLECRAAHGGFLPFICSINHPAPSRCVSNKHGQGRATLEIIKVG